MDNVKELIDKIETLFEKQQYKEIITLLPDNLLNKLNSADLFLWRATGHDRLKENQKVIEYAEKAIAVDPDNALGYFQQGYAYNNIGEYDKAIDNFSRAIALNKKDPGAYNNRGVSWYNKGENDKAIADFDMAIKLKKDDADAYFNRSLAWSNKNEYEKAIADCDKAIELKNDYADAFNGRGAIRYNKGEYDKAMADYDKAIELDNDHAYAYFNRGLVWDKKGEFEKAVADYDRSIELKKDDASTYRSKGDALYALGAYQSSIESYQKAVELDEKYNYLEKQIKLAQEKLEERKILEISKAQPDDKDQKIKIENEIEKTITTIRKAAKSNVKTVVHYTKMLVADIFVKSQEAKMHYSNAIYMNDPMEGKVFFEYLNDETIKQAFLNGERRTETSVYLGSFLPAEEDDGEISHQDELVMWRTYGKDENGKEAAGCSVVLGSEFFKIKPKENDAISYKGISTKGLLNRGNFEEELLNVVYIKMLKNKKEVTNDPLGKIQPALDYLKEQLQRLIKLRDKYERKDDFYKDIENAIFKQLSTISYLFKSADYSYEHEVRVITYMPRDSDAIKYRDIREPNTPNKIFYIESYNGILPYIKRIYLGPKVDNYQKWSLYFDYEIRQRAKELKSLTTSPYEINPSDIEILKSECKFQ